MTLTEARATHAAAGARNATVRSTDVWDRILAADPEPMTPPEG